MLPMRMRHWMLGVLLVAWPVSEAAANASAALPQLDAVVVSGELPGPGLWKVSNDDHVLWILGTLSPVPKHMSWRSSEVERVIAGAQQVLPESAIQVDFKVGWFRGMLLLPKLFGARKNPDKAALADQIPPDLYARWGVLKEKYLPHSRKVETWRPIFAANKLYDEAIEEVGLSGDSIVSPLVRKIAKRHKIPVAEPQVKLTIENPKELLEEFAQTRLNDTECFAKTLDRLESDLAVMKARANAWAIGDIERLRELPFTDPGPDCIKAVLSTEALQKRGLADLPQRAKQAWLDLAASALDKNQVTFATLPMSRILAADGYVEALRARGYSVEAPE